MTRVHEGLPFRDFVRPAAITEAYVCTESGLLATDYCPGIMEYFDVSTVPEEYCSMHWYDYSYYENGYYDAYGNFIPYSYDNSYSYDSAAIDPNTGQPYGNTASGTVPGADTGTYTDPYSTPEYNSGTATDFDPNIGWYGDAAGNTDGGGESPITYYEG